MMDARPRRPRPARRETVLFLDEIHRFTKAQQDALLPGVENRWVILVAATTENPSLLAWSRPLLSRSLLLTLRPLTDDDVGGARRARGRRRRAGLAGAVALDDEAREHLVRLAGGDARACADRAGGRGRGRAVAATGDASRGRPGAGRIDGVTRSHEAAVDRAAVRYDREGDQHYDVTSAFIKSMRGSRRRRRAALPGPHARGRGGPAVHRPPDHHRRQSRTSAWPTRRALQTAVAAAQAVQLDRDAGGADRRWPRPWCTSRPRRSRTRPTSAIDAAIADVRAGLAGPVPAHLRDAHYAGGQAARPRQGLRYAHDDPHGVVEQQYPPDALRRAATTTGPPTAGSSASSVPAGPPRALLRARILARPLTDCAV